MPTKTNAAPLSAERRRVRGKLARTTALAASDPGLTDAVESLRRQYTYLSAAEYIEQVLGVAPALTAAQRDRLAQLLRPGGVDDAT